MYRIALPLLLLLGFSVSALSAPATNPETPAKVPSVDEIKKAIDDLGNKRFAVRERAKKLLHEAGAAAEPFLIEAAKSPDDEVASSAKTILDNFQWGVYPDTPKAVRNLIEKYRNGEPEERLPALGGLLNLKPVPYATIRKLLAKEETPETRMTLTRFLNSAVRESIPNLLAKGDYESVQSQLELILASAPSSAATDDAVSMAAADYAVLMHLRGKTDEAIRRFEKDRLQKGDAGERAAEVLVYLYRIKQDWAASRKAAEDARKSAEGERKFRLVEQVLWLMSDWKALAAHPVKPSNLDGNINIWGLNLAYERLAGNAAAFNEKVEELLKLAEDDMDDELQHDVDALLLNGKCNETLKLLIDSKRKLPLVFDLLCTQMRHKEAFALVNAARGKDSIPYMERGEIEIRRARMLYLLGEKDAATQVFAKLADDFKNWRLPKEDKQEEEPVANITQREFNQLTYKLIKAETGLGLREVAGEHAAKATVQIQKDFPEKENYESVIRGLFQPLFGDEKAAAWDWWKLFRRETPKEDPVIAMKRVRDILSGKLDKKTVDEWAAKMLKAPKADPDRVRPPAGFGRAAEPSKLPDFSAIAAAYRAIGDEAKTGEYLQKAAQTSEGCIAYGDFLMAQKKYKAAAEAYAKANTAKSRANGAGSETGDDDDSLALMAGGDGRALSVYLQARAVIADGDVKEGNRLLELAHWLPLGNESIRAGLVNELNKRQWPEMARKEADMLLKTGWYTDFSYGNVLSFLARQAAKDKDFRLAAEYYQKCLVGCMHSGAKFVESSGYLVVPESVRAYRARDLIAKGKIDEALKEVTASSEVLPGNIDLAIRLVPELDKAGKKKEADALYAAARDTYERLAGDYPNSAYLRNSTAWLMANCGRDLDAALKHATRAVEQEPTNAGYVDTLAEVNFRMKNRDKALELMKRCVELDKKNNYFKRQLVRFKDQSFDSPLPDEAEDDD